MSVDLTLGSMTPWEVTAKPLRTVSGHCPKTRWDSVPDLVQTAALGQAGTVGGYYVTHSPRPPSVPTPTVLLVSTMGRGGRFLQPGLTMRTAQQPRSRVVRCVTRKSAPGASPGAGRNSGDRGAQRTACMGLFPAYGFPDFPGWGGDTAGSCPDTRADKVVHEPADADVARMAA